MAAGCQLNVFPPWIVRFLHSLPHVNFDFDNVTATFAPTDEDYVQGLILYSSVPALFGVLVAFLFFVHFLVFWTGTCCRKKPYRRTKVKCLACMALVTCISALICSGSIIAGFVFNDEVDQGVNNVTNAIKNVNNTLKDAQTQASSIQNTMVDVRLDMADLKNLPNITIAGLAKVLEIETCAVTIIDTLGKIKQTSIPDINSYIIDGEYYRWWATFGILGVETLGCLMVVYAVLKRSRCGLKFLTLLGTLAFLINWTLMGVYLGASMAMSDLCYDPKKTINFYLKTTQPPVKSIIDFYVECKASSVHPYKKYADLAVRELVDAGHVLIWMMKQPWMPSSIVHNLESKFSTTRNSMNAIETDLNCSTVKQQYTDARCAICFPIVGGLSQVLLMTMVIGVFFAIALCFVTPIYHKVPPRKKSRRRNAFEMCSSMESSPPETPFHSISNEEDAPLIPNAPPPTYDACMSSDIQFHSCEERSAHVDTAQTNPINTRNPQPRTGTQTEQGSPANPRIPPPRGTHTASKGEIKSMAF